MKNSSKIRLIKFCFFIFNALVILRLFYWQFLSSEKLSALAESQYYSSTKIAPLRGQILAADGFPLVTNERGYLLYALKNKLNQNLNQVASTLAPIFSSQEASPSAVSDKEEKVKEIEQEILHHLNQEGLIWVTLRHKLPETVKTKIEGFGIEGLGFEEESMRVYPEASSAAHLLGFVGKDEAGQTIGYFGLEGFYNLELKGKAGRTTQEQDAVGRPILLGGLQRQTVIDGNNLKLHLDRGIQLLIENKLRKALEKYGAKAGSVVVSNPKTGAILGMVSLPNYDPANFEKADKDLFKNPVISDFYEPGSTFKIVAMAAALDKGLVKPETRCDICDGPLKIDKYIIRTWNDKYYPGSTMMEVLEHSDNIGMVFISKKLGIDNFLTYYKKFGFDQSTGIDLQEETSPVMRPEEQWSEVDLATASFGQGVATTGLQMLQAVNAIANKGELMRLQVVSEIESEKEVIKKKPERLRQVIKPETAQVLTAMMVEAVDKGEAQWAKPKGFKIAGKTGTSQIPIAGHYDKEKTIASFIGFAPVQDPVFSMLVTLREPTSSPWGSETAAPLWFDIARELFVYFNLQPE